MTPMDTLMGQCRRYYDAIAIEYLEGKDCAFGIVKALYFDAKTLNCRVGLRLQRDNLVMVELNSPYEGRSLVACLPVTDLTAIIQAIDEGNRLLPELN